MDRTTLDSAKQYAFRLLAYSQRSSKQLLDKLLLKNIPGPTAREAVKALERAGCLDDERLAKDFIQSRLRANPAGNKYFRYELMKKQVPEKIIEKALEEVLPPEKELEAAYNAAAKVLAKNSGMDSRKRLKKVYDNLARKGFSSEAASEILSGISTDYREET